MVVVGGVAINFFSIAPSSPATSDTRIAIIPCYILSGAIPGALHARVWGM